MSTMAGSAPLASGYDLHLVALSVAIAIVGAYVGLTLSERVVQHKGQSRYLWLVGGAIAFGSAVWAMHFTGMLAFQLPVSVSYDIPMVILSLVIAIITGGSALLVIARRRMTWLTSCGAAVVMGGGIGMMHYAGMLAMRMPAMTHWDARIIVLSAVVAIVLAFIAMRLSYYLRAVSTKRFGWHRVGASIVIGIAIAGMHYTGMAAATFVPAADVNRAGLLSGDAVGGAAIVLITLLVSGFAIVLAFIDRRFAAQEAALGESQHRLTMVVANAPVMLFAFDAAGIITIAEGRDLATIRRPAESMIGRSFFSVYSDAPALLEQARRALAGTEHTALSVLDGIVLETHWTPVFAGERVDSVIAVATDITERRHAEVALKHQALHDALTGLPNRAYFNQRLAEVLEAAERGGESVTLALIDLDRFKDVNDTLGHAAGDALLQHVAATLSGVLRGDDLVARLGGDEFAVVFADTRDSDGTSLARRLTSALATPCIVNGNRLDVAASMGLATLPARRCEPATLLRNADIAMYSAKHGSGGFALYDASLDRRVAARVALETGMRTGIAEHQFHLYYQPKVDVQSGGLDRVEASIRWSHPALGELAADRFIPLAEESGLIVPLTEWMLEEALRQTRRWDDAGISLGVVVNVSLRACEEISLPATVDVLLARYALPPARLTVQIPESVLMNGNERSRLSIARLATLGIGIAIDEFASSFASGGYLKELPVRELKIATRFVAGMEHDPKDTETVRLIGDFARNLGLRITAGGVETAETWRTLCALGYDVSQGSFVGRPLSAAGLEDWMRTAPWTVPARDAAVAAPARLAS